MLPYDETFEKLSNTFLAFGFLLSDNVKTITKYKKANIEICFHSW